ncbi:MAG: hypothetical protein OIF32_04015 [Campylobacterales bacterium]|nr:hypothetical protein [Campylobacterales bacterium]
MALFADIIKIAYNQDSLAKPIEKSIEDLRKENIKLYPFLRSKMYQKNGALLGLIKNYIQFAVVKEEFLQDIVLGELNNKNLEKINFFIVTYYEDNYIITRKKYYDKLSKDKKSKIVTIFNKNFKGLEND